MFYVLAVPKTQMVYPYTLTDLRFAHPTVNFPNHITDDMAAKYSCFPVQPTNPPAASNGQKAVLTNPENINSTWFEKWVLVNRTVEEIEIQWDSIRAERNARLSASDWTQITDSPLNATQKANWAVHRQQLRDIPMTQTDPFNIIWPSIK